MSDDVMFGQTLTTWLEAEADHRVPDHLHEVLVRTAATGQRAWWSSPERWLPMDTTTSFGRRFSAPRALLVFAVLALLVTAVVGGAIVTGTLRPTSPTLGPVTNGRIYAADGASIRSFAADGTDPKVVTTFTNDVDTISMSPDGRRVAANVLSTPGHIEIVDLDTGKSTPVVTPTPMDVGGVSWSPDGRQIMFATFDGSIEHLYMASSDGTGATEIHPDTIAAGSSYFPVGWSPKGDRIAFVSGAAGGDSGGLYTALPTGRDVQRVSPDEVLGDTASWYPDPGIGRLAYTAVGNVVKIVDLGPTGRVIVVNGGFWPTWSPDGHQLSYWTSGTVLTSTDAALALRPDAIHPYPLFTGYCPDHPELKGKAFCGPAVWSPDSQRLIAPDIVGDQLLSVRADGNGDPILMPLDVNAMNKLGTVAWRPAR